MGEDSVLLVDSEFSGLLPRAFLSAPSTSWPQ